VGDENGSLIVGIGASAGGIQAVRRFLERLPTDSGIVCVVVLHLSPKHVSSLAEVLSTSTTLPVTQVDERVAVEPNHVYVIPPNRSLRMVDGSLEVSEVTSFEERRAPVDIFFRTLAESHHNRAVAVVLSGTGANGSMGIKRIKELGGIAIVQDPDEAQYGDMPRNSIATRLVDHVLPVVDIPRRILAYRDTFGAVQLPERPPAHPQSDEDALRDVFAQLRIRTGHDFSNYKRATVVRRIARRMSLNDLTDIAAYAQFTHDQPEESQALLNDLLISVTNFFRNRDVFESVERHIVPKLFERKSEDDHVRVWVPGCATGEEAYSIAMLLAEHSASARVAGDSAVRDRHRRGRRRLRPRGPVHAQRRG
jgi:two-component system, chemotaxis family, CheB/CheR fusion protein